MYNLESLLLITWKLICFTNPCLQLQKGCKSITGTFYSFRSFIKAEISSIVNFSFSVFKYIFIVIDFWENTLMLSLVVLNLLCSFSAAYCVCISVISNKVICQVQLHCPNPYNCFVLLLVSGFFQIGLLHIYNVHMGDTAFILTFHTVSILNISSVHMQIAHPLSSMVSN